MASIRITIETDGAAFHSGNAYPTMLAWETARILRDLAAIIAANGVENRFVKDYHKNVCGTVEVID